MRQSSTAVVCTLAALLAACGGGGAREDERAVWRSLGYGLVLDNRGSTPVLFERTATSCLRGNPIYTESIPLSASALSADGERISARMGIDAVPVTFERLDGVPLQCRDGGTPTVGDPGYSVDPRRDLAVFCDTFLENYAFFELRGVDFAALCAEAADRVDAQTTPDELLGILVSMIEPLDDGHVVLYRDLEHSFSAARDPEVVEELREEWLGQTEVASLDEYVALKIARHEEIVAEYLGGSPETAVNGVVAWGRLDEQTGYLAVRSMWNPQAPREEQVASIGAGVDLALADLGDLPAMVLDVRTNPGGHDAVGLAVAGRFRAGTHEAFTVAARHEGGFTEPYRVDVSASGPRQFTGRLAVLTSELTASAAETFLLALQTRPDTVLVGETTEGVFSDALPRSLPNGWVVTLSNERYLGPDGRAPEGTGIVPDVEVDCFTRADRDAGTDAAIAAALDLL